MVESESFKFGEKVRNLLDLPGFFSTWVPRCGSIIDMVGNSNRQRHYILCCIESARMSS
jgi:hypothetical protein